MTLITSYITEYNYAVPFISVVAVLVASIFSIVFKKRKNLKAISIEIENHRILTYQPEPLIDTELVKDWDQPTLELLEPKEIEGTYNLAKINFFNLLDNEEIKEVAKHCIETYGVGSCGPRGFYGTIDIHLKLENKIAEFMGLEETILYSYGFSTIASAIGAYCKNSDVIFSDEKISFAAQQGFLAARSKVVYFKHNDMKDLEKKLMEYKKKEQVTKKITRKFLIVEGIYQKTGTICPLPELMSLREIYKLRIFIDETLSFGVLGKCGRGVTEYFDIDRTDVDMIMGSLEGSIGSIGGFCVGASVVMEHQRLSGLGYCFSASLPPFLSDIAIYAIDLFTKDVDMFKKLIKNSNVFHNQLESLPNCQLISNPDSPLKVIKLTDKVNAAKVHKYSQKKNLHLIQDEEYLYLYVNIAMNDKDFKNIMTILRETL